MPPILYLTPGVFDMGGIARYGRYQIDALRSLVGSLDVRVVSMLGPEPGGFDTPFPVDFFAGGNRRRHKVLFTLASLSMLAPRSLYWSAHLHYAPLAFAYAKATRGIPIVNIYGLEVWSSPPRASKAVLPHCHVVSDCHATLDYAVSKGLVDPDKATVIWDPVDLERFHPAPPDPDLARRLGLALDGRFRVMFLGRLATGAMHKGPDALLRAFARAKLPHDAELVIAGSGDRLPALQELARELGLGERVRFLGRIAESDLAGLYRLASLFVLVSRRYEGGGEGIPLTPLEAAACGVPIVVGDEDGSREAVVEGETGFIVPSRDEDALVATLERCAASPDLLRKLGEGAARRAAECFSYERFVKEHAALLERLRMQ